MCLLLVSPTHPPPPPPPQTHGFCGVYTCARSIATPHACFQTVDTFDFDFHVQDLHHWRTLLAAPASSTHDLRYILVQGLCLHQIPFYLMLHEIKTAELRLQWLAQKVEHTALAVITCSSSSTGASNEFQLPQGFTQADPVFAALPHKCLLVRLGKASSAWDQVGNTGLRHTQDQVAGRYRGYWAVPVKVLAVVDSAVLVHCRPGQTRFRVGVPLSCLNTIACLTDISPAQAQRMTFPP